MSKYTTEVRFICENFAGLTESVGYSDVEEVLDKSWQKVFNIPFTILNAEYTENLCKKILRHYYTREIGFETVGLWQIHLNQRMIELSPYYNDLLSAYTDFIEEYSPFEDIDLTRQHILDTTSNLNSDSTVKNVNKYSETPQGGLVGVETGNYLTSATIDEGNTDTSQNSTSKDEYIETVKGKQSGKSYSEMLEEFKNALINVDLEIINKLSDLFMLIW